MFEKHFKSLIGIFSGRQFSERQFSKEQSSWGQFAGDNFSDTENNNGIKLHI